MTVKFLPDAKEEITATAMFYHRQAAGLGERFLDDVERAAQLLRQQPSLGQQLDDDLHQLILHRFPFSLIYAREPNAVLIVAIAHQRRRPGYWREL
jgi:plasmid stabilization system protein ParE